MGVVSWGVTPCAGAGNSVVYSRVEYNMDWIRQTVCEDFGVTDAEFCGGGDDDVGYDTIRPTSSPTAGSSEEGSTSSGDCGPSEIYMFFEIQTGSYGSETSWDMRYSNGAIMYSDSGFIAGEMRQYEGCLSSSEGSFYLTVYDSYGDGMGYPHNGVDPYLYIVFGEESYRGNQEFTTDISFELAPL
jgi:hypothetical protein